LLVYTATMFSSSKSKTATHNSSPWNELN